MRGNHGGRTRSSRLLYVDQRVVGVIEAKPVGTPLSGVEWQSAMYADGLPADVRLAALTKDGRLPFVFEASGVNQFFRNGVLVDGDELLIFQDGIPQGYETLSTPVPLTYVQQGEDLVVSVYAGTKAAPEVDENENNDDFTIKNLRLVLPDGRTLRPAGYDDPDRVLNMGDSSGKLKR